VRGVLADSGWGDVDPRKSGVVMAVQTSPLNGCCTVGPESWQKLFKGHYGFFDQQRGICPPLACASVTVHRTGSVSFKLTAPGIEVTETTLPDILLGAVIGQHCSVGSVPPITLRQKGNALVFP
jgi:hypothetical protein